MTLAQLRYLLAIVDAGLNITLAAERVNATQPGLSKQLKQLEEELGVQLFVRHGRNLDRLTDAGGEIVERARIIASETENIRAFVANQRADPGGSLSVETTHIQAQFVLPHVLPQLQRAYPDLNVELGFAADSSDLARHRGDAHLMLFSTDGRLPAGDLAIPLFSWKPVALVLPEHPLAARSARPTLAELASFPLITYDTSRTAPLSLARTFLEAGLSPRFAYTLRDAEVIKTMTRRGLGIGLLAEMGIDPEGEEGLAVIPLDGLFRQCVTWAVLRRDRVLREPVIELLSLLSGINRKTIARVAAGDEPLPPNSSLPSWPERLEMLKAIGAVPASGSGHLRLASAFGARTA